MLFGVVVSKISLHDWLCKVLRLNHVDGGQCVGGSVLDAATECAAGGADSKHDVPRFDPDAICDISPLFGWNPKLQNRTDPFVICLIAKTRKAKASLELCYRPPCADSSDGLDRHMTERLPSCLYALSLQGKRLDLCEPRIRDAGLTALFEALQKTNLSELVLALEACGEITMDAFLPLADKLPRSVTKLELSVSFVEEIVDIGMGLLQRFTKALPPTTHEFTFRLWNRKQVRPCITWQKKVCSALKPDLRVQSGFGSDWEALDRKPQPCSNRIELNARKISLVHLKAFIDDLPHDVSGLSLNINCAVTDLGLQVLVEKLPSSLTELNLDLENWGDYFKNHLGISDIGLQALAVKLPHVLTKFSLRLGPNSKITDVGLQALVVQLPRGLKNLSLHLEQYVSSTDYEIIERPPSLPSPPPALPASRCLQPVSSTSSSSSGHSSGRPAQGSLGRSRSPSSSSTGLEQRRRCTPSPAPPKPCKLLRWNRNITHSGLQRAFETLPPTLVTLELSFGGVFNVSNACAQVLRPRPRPRPGVFGVKYAPRPEPTLPLKEKTPLP